MARFDPHPDRRPALVTGASSGIGAAVARTLGAAGFPVALGARRVEVCEQIASELRAAGGEAVAFHLDLEDPASVDAFVERAGAALGPIEVVVSNAATVTPGTGLGVDPEGFERQVRVNVLSTQRLVAAAGVGLLDRRRGDIVFVTSDVVRAPRPYIAAYQASKWAVEGFAHALQMELEGTGVRVSIIRPGQTATEMGSDWSQEMTEAVLGGWIRWGLARHSGVLLPDAVATAVHAVVTAPRGTHYLSMEVQPEAPVRRQDPDDAATASTHPQVPDEPRGGKENP